MARQRFASPLLLRQALAPANSNAWYLRPCTQQSVGAILTPRQATIVFLVKGAGRIVFRPLAFENAAHLVRCWIRNSNTSIFSQSLAQFERGLDAWTARTALGEGLRTWRR